MGNRRFGRRGLAHSLIIIASEGAGRILLAGHEYRLLKRSDKAADLIVVADCHKSHSILFDGKEEAKRTTDPRFKNCAKLFGAEQLC